MTTNLLTLLSNLKTAWNTIKKFLPKELKNDIKKIDSRFSNIQKELGTEPKGNIDKIKIIIISLNNIVYALLQEVKQQNPNSQIISKLNNIEYINEK
jgi:hypothetical protein